MPVRFLFAVLLLLTFPACGPPSQPARVEYGRREPSVATTTATTSTTTTTLTKAELAADMAAANRFADLCRAQYDRALVVIENETVFSRQQLIDRTCRIRTEEFLMARHQEGARRMLCWACARGRTRGNPDLGYCLAAASLHCEASPPGELHFQIVPAH